MKKFLEIFLIFLKIGAFTIGGGYAMLPLIQVEVVDKKEWLSTDEFMDMLAVIQSAPGLISINSAIFIGYKIGGLREAIAGSLGAVIPSFSIILVIANFFSDFREYSFVEGIFMGIRPAVLALIVAAVYKLAKSISLSKKGIIIYLISLASIVLLGIHPIYLILVTAIFSIFTANQSVAKGRE